MLELPLFPLNTVLFPGMPISLHIFEERYKQLVKRCLETQGPFGVALIQRGSEAHGPLPEPHPIGCTAQIAQMEPLGQGRMNILAVGVERFRILALNSRDYPYLVGAVELFPMPNEDPQALDRAAQDLYPWVARYLALLSRTGRARAELQRRPEDPLAFGYLAATLLRIAPAQTQALLTAENAVQLLTRLRALYQREVMLLDILLNPHKEERNAGGFSLS